MVTRYQHVIQILDQAIGGPTSNIGYHGAFWRGLTRDQFVAKMVFGNQLVIVGQGANSKLVKALRGQAPFGSDLSPPPDGAIYPRMPNGLPPVGDVEILFVEKWIDEGCLEDAFTK